MDIKGFEPRRYQSNIASVCMDKNTLVVLPTGLGKTKIALIVAMKRLNQFKGYNVIMVAPTRPLAAQIQREFIENTTLGEEDVVLVTGVLTPKKRKEAYEMAKVIVGTPQTVDNDAMNDVIDLKYTCLLVLDEVHRAVKKYAHAKLVKKYLDVAKEGRVVGLTASPGNDKAMIDTICKTLDVHNVEVYDETHEDVVEYVQKKDIEYVKVPLPNDIKQIAGVLRGFYNSKLSRLQDSSYLKGKRSINRKDLLVMQRSLQAQLKRGNPLAYSQISLVALLMKLSYSIELLETQGLRSFIHYVDKLQDDTSKAAKTLLGDAGFNSSVKLVIDMIGDGKVHPKMEKMKDILMDYVKNKPKMRTIIFTNFRNTVDEIDIYLSAVEGLKPIQLVGQKEGLKQSEQIERIDDFSKGKYNCLITTSIGEEGLSIKEADLAIFYDHTSMSVRRIQRGGRVGRVTPGKIIYLIVKGTRDESLFWASHYGVKKMKQVLDDIKKKEPTLNDYD